MKVKVLWAILVFWVVSISGQDFAVKVWPESYKCLPGAPDNLEVTITNVSGKDLWIAGKSMEDGISLEWPVLINEKGEKINCLEHSSPSMLPPIPNAPISGKTLFKKGESYKTSSGSLGEEACPLTMDLTGIWKGQIIATIKIAEGPLVKDIRKVVCAGEMTVEFQRPEGEDLAYIEAVKDWLNKADQKEALGQKAQTKPLTWGELITSFRIPVNEILLQKYPTSTYAGYILAKKIPDYSNPLFKPVPPEEQVRLAKEEGKTFMVFPDKDFDEYFQQIEKAVKGGNISESFRASFYCFYGDQLIRRGRYAEAEEAFCRAIEVEPQSNGKEKVYYDRAKAFLEALKKSNKKDESASGKDKQMIKKE